VFSLTMKSMTTFNQLILVLITVIGITTNLMAEETASILQSPATAATDRYGKIYSKQILKGVTLKDVYKFNAQWTTAIGPAYANIVEQSSNFIKCKPPSGREFSYALCYYSGPAQPTGSNPDNPPLPCTLSKDGKVANCTCYAISNKGAGAKTPYLVDINAISNQFIYQETTASCGRDGADCTDTSSEPPTCEAINTNLLVPGADLVSVFSPLYANNYASQTQSTPLTSCTGLYAGCMTAPCTRTGKYDGQGNELVSCECPVYTGPYQIRTSQPELQRQRTGADWEDDRRRGRGISGPLPITRVTSHYRCLDAKCTPDMAGKNGCPLYNPDKPVPANVIDPNGQLCKNVCASYQNSTPTTPGLQVGYTCDSTLCTTVGIGQNKLTYNPSVKAQASLSGQACQGVGQMTDVGQIALVESLANCSCCASQICGCDTPNDQTNQAVYRLNQEQRDQTIKPQCDINGTLCGKP